MIDVKKTDFVLVKKALNWSYNLRIIWLPNQPKFFALVIESNTRFDRMGKY